MMRYSEFQPTGFDRKGAFLRDRQDWIVVPVNQARDSCALERSNFEAALDLLGGESEVVEVHRFDHWGPGWFEIIIVDPNSEKAQVASDIKARLQTYTVLDEESLALMELKEE